MAHFNDFKIQLITSPAGTPEARRCVEAALSLSILNLLARCNQMRRKCGDPGVTKFPEVSHGWGRSRNGAGAGCEGHTQHLPGLPGSASHLECGEELQQLQTFPAGLPNSIQEEATQKLTVPGRCLGNGT